MMQTATHCRGVDVALDYSAAIRQRHDAVSPATQTQVAELLLLLLLLVLALMKY